MVDASHVVDRAEDAVDLRGAHVVFVLAGEVLGGAERGALEIGRDLGARFGVGVTVLALDGRPGPARHFASELGIPWVTAGVRWAGGPAGKASALARFTRVGRQLRPDLLVSSTNAPNVFSGLTWRATGARSFVWRQCDVNGSQRFGGGVCRRALRSASLVLTTTQPAVEWLEREWGGDPARIRVVQAPIRVPEPRLSAAEWRANVGATRDDVVAVMLAHFHPGKDHPTVLRAWRLVVENLEGSGSRPLLVLTGRDAGAGADLRTLVEQLDLAAHVRFLGETEDVGGILAASDLAVFASHRELLPRGVLEPMAVGLPVVAIDAPGVREAIGQPGAALLAPPGDAPALAQRVLDLVRDREARVQLGRANRELIRARQDRETSADVLARLLVDEAAA